ncbi:MAG: hypothetical protein IJA97_01315 [Clostridia bacterium]|nr:hypothetical protein [Clostridia bacterium]
MQNFKDVCGQESVVWFEVQPSDCEKFLKWAKDLGCVWLSGTKINFREPIKFTHFSINNEGKLGIIPISTWASKQTEFQNIKRYEFCEFVSL